MLSTHFCQVIPYAKFASMLNESISLWEVRTFDKYTYKYACLLSTPADSVIAYGAIHRLPCWWQVNWLSRKKFHHWYTQRDLRYVARLCNLPRGVRPGTRVYHRYNGAFGQARACIIATRSGRSLPGQAADLGFYTVIAGMYIWILPRTSSFDYIVAAPSVAMQVLREFPLPRASSCSYCCLNPWFKSAWVL